MGSIALALDDGPSTSKKSHHVSIMILALLALVGVACYHSHIDPLPLSSLSANHPTCPRQPDPIYPNIPFKPELSFPDEAARRLEQAVQFPTISYDDNGLVGEDVRSLVSLTHNHCGPLMLDDAAQMGNLLQIPRIPLRNIQRRLFPSIRQSKYRQSLRHSNYDTRERCLPQAYPLNFSYGRRSRA